MHLYTTKKRTLQEVQEMITQIKNDVGGYLYSELDLNLWKRIYKNMLEKETVK